MSTTQHNRLSALEKAAPGRYEPMTIQRIIIYKDGSRKSLPPRTVPTYPAGVKRPRA